MFKIIIEALIVGFYSCIIFIIINSITLNKLSIYKELFIIGFFKHLIGYYSNIHKYYCNYYNNRKKISNNNRIITESFIEGFVFLLIGIIINLIVNYNKNKIYFYFSIGFILHIMAEFSGIHHYFCNL